LKEKKQKKHDYLLQDAVVEGIKILNYSVSVVRKHINELNLKGKIKARARERGKNKPTLVARIA
jgi:hypothetical protein